jgi:hypothetical protein
MTWWYGPYVWPFQLLTGYGPSEWSQMSREQRAAAVEDEERCLQEDLEIVMRKLQSLR